MSSGVYLATFKKATDGTRAINFASDTFKAILLTNSYSPDFTLDSVYSDISANEAVGTGYSSGGQALTGVSWTTTGGLNKFTSDSPAWTTSSITARFCVIYDTSASNALICCMDFGGDMRSVAATFTVPIDATSGILEEVQG